VGGRLTCCVLLATLPIVPAIIIIITLITTSREGLSEAALSQALLALSLDGIM
jgi:hypothetical protein